MPLRTIPINTSRDVTTASPFPAVNVLTPVLFGTLAGTPGVGSFTSLDFATIGTHDFAHAGPQYRNTNFWVNEFNDTYTLNEYIPATQTTVQHNTVTLNPGWGFSGTVRSRNDAQVISGTLMVFGIFGTSSVDRAVVWVIRSGTSISLSVIPYTTPANIYGQTFRIDDTHAGMIASFTTQVDVWTTGGLVASHSVPANDQFYPWEDNVVVSNTYLMEYSSPTSTPTITAITFDASFAALSPLETLTDTVWKRPIDSTHRFVDLLYVSGIFSENWTAKVVRSGAVMSVVDAVPRGGASSGLLDAVDLINRKYALLNNYISYSYDLDAFPMFDTEIAFGNNVLTGGTAWNAIAAPGDGTTNVITGSRWLILQTTYNALGTYNFHPTVPPGPATIDGYEPTTGAVLHTRSDSGYKLLAGVGQVNGKIVVPANKYTHYGADGLPDDHVEGWLVYPPDLSTATWVTFDNDAPFDQIPINSGTTWVNQVHTSVDGAYLFEIGTGDDGLIIGYNEAGTTVASHVVLDIGFNGGPNFGTSFEVGPSWGNWCWDTDHTNIFCVGFNQDGDFEESIFYGPIGGPYARFYDNQPTNNNYFHVENMTVDETTGLLYVAWLVPESFPVRAIHVLQFDRSGNITNTYAPSDSLLQSFSGTYNNLHSALDVYAGTIYMSYYHGDFVETNSLESDNNLIFKINAGTGVGTTGHWATASQDRAVTGLRRLAF